MRGRQEQFKHKHQETSFPSRVPSTTDWTTDLLEPVVPAVCEPRSVVVRLRQLADGVAQLFGQQRVSTAKLLHSSVQLGQGATAAVQVLGKTLRSTSVADEPLTAANS